MAPTGSNSEDGNTSSPRSSSPKKTVKKRDTAKLKWFFTWNNPETAPWLRKKLIPICKYFIFQKEIGDEEGTEHFQGCLSLKKKQRLSFMKKIHKAIHWEQTRNEQAAIEYCLKEETFDGERVIYGITPEQEDIIETIETLRCWQDELNCILKRKPDSRHIYWIIDEDGNAGKTEFVRWYAINNPHSSICANAGNGKDVANLLKNYAEKQKISDFRVFLYNMARDATISYRMLECMKDGMMTNTKYEASTLIFNRPHVVVMSNEPPETDKLSKDRWIIYKIKNQMLVDDNDYV